MSKLELGVFLPIGNNGFLMSKTAPQYPPSFEMNKQIAVLAENLGFDYVFSMSKWRGFGGATHFWDSTLESVSLMTGLAAVTSRIGIIATIQPVLFPPAVAAKMAATIDDLSGGRFGINIVTGSFLDEYEPDGHSSAGLRQESLSLCQGVAARREAPVDRGIGHFRWRVVPPRIAAQSPKPVQKPHPFIICAGTSDEGFRFTAKEGNYSFIGGITLEHTKQLSQRMKATAAEAGRAVKTATTLLPILDETDAAAEKQWQYIQDGADKEALATLATTTAKEDAVAKTPDPENGARRILRRPHVPGTPATLGGDHRRSWSWMAASTASSCSSPTTSRA